MYTQKVTVEGDRFMLVNPIVILHTDTHTHLVLAYFPSVLVWMCRYGACRHRELCTLSSKQQSMGVRNPHKWARFEGWAS